MDLLNLVNPFLFYMIIGNRIGYKISSLGKTIFQTFNPRLNQCNEEHFVEAIDSEIEEALFLAKKAFEEYQFFSGEQRNNFLKEIHSQICLNEKTVIEFYCKESGLTEIRAQVELNRTKQQLLNFADLILIDEWRSIRHESPDYNRHPVKPELKKALFPIGPVVVFGASNFPFAYSTIGGDTVAALAAGCSVVFKSHPMHAGTSDLMASLVIKAAQRTGMPEGIFSHLNTKDYLVGEKLVQHQFVKAIGFTGSVKGGKSILELVGKREELIPVFAEMGSSNPVVVLTNKVNTDKIENWTDLLAESITNSAGQFCTKPGLLFVLNDDLLDSFKDHLISKTLSKDFQCMLHPDMHNHFQALVDQRRDLIEVIEKQGNPNPNFAKPTLGFCSGKVFLANPNLQDEVFGPFSMMIVCDSMEELLLALSSLHGQLTGSIFCEEEVIQENIGIIIRMQSKVGRMIFNGVPTGVEIVSAMHHGGPYPASSDSRFTAVGIDSIKRFVRPVSFQNYPEKLLPSFLNF